VERLSTKDRSGSDHSSDIQFFRGVIFKRTFRVEISYKFFCSYLARYILPLRNKNRGHHAICNDALFLTLLQVYTLKVFRSAYVVAFKSYDTSFSFL